MSDTKALPLLERVKVEGDALRGTIVESLNDEITGAMREEDTLLMKFHGMYQQDDRDRRGKSEKETGTLVQFYDSTAYARRHFNFRTMDCPE